MNKRLCLVFIVFFLAGTSSYSQFSKYIVRFRDKGTSPYSISNPSAFLTQRALDRRIRYGISIDSLDLPVTPRYIDSIRAAGNVSVLNISKWLNQVSIETTDAAALVKINSLPFVLSTEPIAARSAIQPVNKRLDISPSVTNIQGSTTSNLANVYDYGQSLQQVTIHNGNFLHNHGFRGEGMHMAVLDAGFLNYNILPTFDSALQNNQLLGEWDFVDNESSVAEDYYHGMQCLSTITANVPGSFIGTAPKTSFYLYRTEDVGSEYPIEEHNWVCGVERADSLGVDLCSTSLGYSTFDNPLLNYTYADMNGNTTISARGSDIASAKGMLMVSAAGNEGTGSWHFLITPSDADSALAVGAVNVAGQPAAFSSYGPSSDGQVKPSVAAVGWNSIVASPFNGEPTVNSGTSFACPNMAGITTCLWQAFPDANNMLLIDVLEKASSRYENPDDRTGYGVPDAKKAFVMLQKMFHASQAVFNDCKINLQFSVKTDPTMNIDIERMLEGETSYTTIATLSDNNGWAKHQFNYTDNLYGTSAAGARYRLRMNIDTDTSYILDSMAVDFSFPCNTANGNDILVGPNPATDVLNVRIVRTEPTKIEIALLNEAGQRVYRNSFNHPAGILTTVIPMNTFSRGTYFLAVYANGKRQITRKIIHR